jgi:hypothetical protein
LREVYFFFGFVFLCFGFFFGFCLEKERPGRKEGRKEGRAGRKEGRESGKEGRKE